ncbi:gluconate 2-dehydrogenase subunit 3 family protein [Sinirhodobacter sp. WL0062]|uniref:Gluconate 2-dehydrogenase subunit 3 family protein n=1 Tax=Rhodobacter flavimaris TaxID=2907145 RepID=A0ABS8YRQ2_9RHOB|nr:gluconate 2-dehydrogenase subunit 3 family protein [Sinirhodobacter sp. WL0062]MCE5972554.1 gluconate 2-dehydrogenase subunit 3 family protein [Sinirhodobacter sp. WL0062]
MPDSDWLEAAAPRLSRRSLLFQALSASLAGFAVPVLAQEGQVQSLGSLGSVLDTLLPADEFSPSATALRVDQDVMDFVAQNQLMLRLFVAALGWMDSLSDRPFGELPAQQRIAILSAMEQADYNQIPGRFFHILRSVAIEFYYARPEAIAGYPLSPAPQPAGYPPPWS